ncbi:MAG: ComEC/Rec2 family competence protein [Candidatus Pacebacteria bacterium]|nr:ComEC/Rec2 family competence protein [Candidatus Paceibacterota bacterium]
MHKAQVFGYLLISFLVGVFCGPWFGGSNTGVLAMILVGTIIVVVSAYEKTFVNTKTAERNRRVGVLIGACVLVLALGVFRYGQANLVESALTEFATHQYNSPSTGEKNKGIPVITKGFVDGEMAVDGDKAQLVLHATEVEVGGRKFPVNELTLIFLKAYPVYHYGDLISVDGALMLPDNFSPDFDYVQYLKNKSIRTTIPYPKIIFDSKIHVSTFQGLKIGFYKKIFAIKDSFESSVSRSLGVPYSAYINGVLLGTKQDIPAELTDAFNKTSTTHVLAISGYNITIIGEALLAVLVFFMRRRRAFWVSVGFIIVFTIMTGAGASVVRAAVMGLLLLFANGYGRLYDPKNSILFAGAAMVLIDPLALRFDVGFQLSFLAVLGLMYVGPLLKERFKKIPEWMGLKETVLMSVSAQIMVAPLLAYTFHTFSLVSIPANLLVLPLMPYTMLFGFLTGLAGFVASSLGQAVGTISWILSWWQLSVVKWFGGLSFSAVTVMMPAFILIGLYALIIFGIWSVKKLQKDGSKTN